MKVAPCDPIALKSTRYLPGGKRISNCSPSVLNSSIRSAWGSLQTLTIERSTPPPLFRQAVLTICPLTRQPFGSSFTGTANSAKGSCSTQPQNPASPRLNHPKERRLNETDCSLIC